GLAEKGGQKGPRRALAQVPQAIRQDGGRHSTVFGQGNAYVPRRVLLVVYADDSFTAASGTGSGAGSMSGVAIPSELSTLFSAKAVANKIMFNKVDTMSAIAKAVTSHSSAILLPIQPPANIASGRGRQNLGQTHF
ncbi:MAG: hypothetical protein ACPGR8_17495, partial [Limisphaerales bacterium]